MTQRLALFDIDGVLANDTHRVEFALAREWDDYFRHDRVEADEVWPEGRDALDAEVARGDALAYLTGRREDLRTVTEKWLAEHNFPQAPLYMRPINVKVPLANLKTDVISQILATGVYSSVVLYDDDPEVIRLVRETLGEDAGVHCTWHVKQKALVKEAKA